MRASESQKNIFSFDIFLRKLIDDNIRPLWTKSFLCIKLGFFHMSMQSLCSPISEQFQKNTSCFLLDNTIDNIFLQKHFQITL